MTTVICTCDPTDLRFQAIVVDASPLSLPAKLTAPFPASDYLATLKVQAQGQGARVTWLGRLTGKGVSDEEVVALFNVIYQGGLEALRANYPV
ncbi:MULTISPECIES: SRPBCC family protein [unclassified Pseudomonas]|uniref:SRPBCC family protein n=1 Tax=unclassified Pseudomonas TaxID=196821 RepID=UPI0030D744B0